MRSGTSLVIKQRGLGLTEIVIGIFLASIIMTALMQHYLKCKQQYKHSQKLLETAFELQLVSDLIRDSVRSAGFTPCLSINALKTIDRRSDKRNLTALEIISRKSQTLHSHRMSENFASILEFLDPRSLLVTSEADFLKQQTILIADCYHAEVQEILSMQKSATGTLLTVKKPLAFTYTNPVYVGEWLEEAFFVQKNRRNKLALFYQLDHTEELTSLVNHLTILRKNSLGKTFLQVILSLDKAPEIHLEVSVRAG